MNIHVMCVTVWGVGLLTVTYFFLNCRNETKRQSPGQMLKRL